MNRFQYYIKFFETVLFHFLFFCTNLDEHLKMYACHSLCCKITNQQKIHFKFVPKKHISERKPVKQLGHNKTKTDKDKNAEAKE